MTQKNRTGDDPHLTVQTTTIEADVEIVSVDADGNASMRMSMHDFAMEMAGQPSVAQANKMFAGFRMHVGARVSPTGAVSDSDFGIDADPSGMLRATMKPMMESFGQTTSQLSVPLPDEAVGVGGRGGSKDP